jgi:hypothetical protein
MQLLFSGAIPSREEVRGVTAVLGIHDLHHCLPWEGGLAVANTGLETVDHVSLDGDLLHRWDLLDAQPRARRIDPDLDYRRIADRKPHLQSFLITESQTLVLFQLDVLPQHLWV